MAAYTTNLTKHQTLSGTTEDTVTLGNRVAAVEVTNFDATTALYFAFNRDTALTAGDDDSFVVPVSSSKLVPCPSVAGLVVHLVGLDNAYAVEGHAE